VSSKPYEVDAEEDGNPNRLRWLLLGLGGSAVVLLVIWWPGCRQYPAVTSRESLGLMKLLYSACNTKDTERLAKVEQGVEKAINQGKMSPQEQQAFARIIGMARTGDWPSAERAAFKFAQDQVGVGHAAPKGHDHDHDHDHDHKPPKRKPR
jgi:hypothetical protein